MNMYQDAFTKLESDEVSSILETYNPMFDGCVFEARETTIMAQDISFYPGCRYLDIADYSSIPPIRRQVIDGPDCRVVLDWSNAPIYQLNQSIPIHLNSNTVYDYVRFFFDHVRGKNGRFFITENIDDIRWHEEPPLAARKTIGEMLSPMMIMNFKQTGNYVLAMNVMFKDSLFECHVHVDSKGHINLQNEKLLIEEMPVIDCSFG